jgi:prepilin-type N-terminal cleavage/methylation domain-containing protein
MHRESAFTLIELLVVITIIVVLLAMLTPALDRALYSAEMAICGANQKGIATGAIQYASGNGRKYPYRPNIVSDNGWQRPNCVSHPGLDDDRRYLSPTIGMKSLLDPFAGEIDISASAADASAFSNYELWFGMRYKAQGGQGMLRIGDRFTWNENSTPAKEHRFNVLVSCEEKSDSGNGQCNAHPDSNGVTKFYTAQNSATSDGWGYGNTTTDGKYTLSRWVAFAPRGVFDLNYAFDDNSVQRFDEVLMGEEPRMEKVPWVANGAATTSLWTHLPTTRE